MKVAIIGLMGFADWLTEKYLDWQKESGSRKTLAEFAIYLNVPMTSLSAWMNGKYQPKSKYIADIADKLGADAYDVLGLPQPLYVRELRAVPQALRERFLSAAEEISTAIYGTAMDPESPEALKIAESIMEKYGFRLTDTTQ